MIEHAAGPKVAMLADAHPGAGLGHVVRSGALAAALRTRGIAVTCHALGAVEEIERDGVRWQPAGAIPDAELVVVDSYRIDPADLPSGAGLMVMHDHGGAPPAGALVLSVAAESHDPRWLTGLRHACLRPAFWGLPEAVPGDEVRRVLVTTGGADPGGMAAEITAAVAEALPGAEVAVVVGPQADFEPPHGARVIRAPELLLEPLRAADLVISAAGQTMLEAAAVGTPTIALVLVENQLRQARRVADADAARVLEGPSAAAVADAARQLAGNRAARHELSARGQRAVDGFGALRVAFRIDQELRA